MKPAAAVKQNLLTFHEQFKVENNCNAYCATSRLTVSAEQKEQGITTNTGLWKDLQQGSLNTAVLSAHLRLRNFFAGACRYVIICISQ
jgi:hypothetical protein